MSLSLSLYRYRHRIDHYHYRYRYHIRHQYQYHYHIVIIIDFSDQANIASNIDKEGWLLDCGQYQFKLQYPLFPILSFSSFFHSPELLPADTI